MEINVLATRVFGYHLKFVYLHERRFIYFGLAFMAVVLQCYSIITRLQLPGYRATMLTNLCAFAAWGCAFLQYREQAAAGRLSEYASTKPSFSILPLLWFAFWLLEVLVTLDIMILAH